MTTFVEFKKYVRPLLDAGHPLAFGRGALFVVPVGHVFLALAFHATSWKTGFKVTAEIRPVFAENRLPYLGFLFVQHAYWPKHNYWLSDKTENFPAPLLEAIAGEVLPVFRSLVTVEACRECFVDRYQANTTGYWDCLVGFDLMLGEFSVAAKRLATRPGDLAVPYYRECFGSLLDELMLSGDAMDRGQKQKLFDRMHEQEAVAIRNFKLEKHWQPSPFPAEEKGLV